MKRGKDLAVGWEYVSNSLWALPSLMFLFGFPAATTVLMLDAPVGATPNLNWLIYSGTAAEAMDISSALLGAMVTMTSLIFSITILVLTLAASHYGPRLVRSFMGNWYTQLVLGTYILTINFCLITLFAMGIRNSEARMLMPSVTVEIGLSLISILMLVFFLHNLARSIVAETLIERVGRELDRQLSFLPNAVDEAAPDLSAVPVPEGRSAFVGVAEPGYVQRVDHENLLALASRHNLSLVLGFRPGDYLAAEGNDIEVRPATALSPRVTDEIRRAVQVGSRRTPVQDPEFSIRHLVEIAIRALSPGINDPYTAAAVVDRLSGSLAPALSRSLSHKTIFDFSGRARIHTSPPTWASLLGAAFNQIRQSGASKPLLVIHLMNALGRLAEHIRVPAQAEALRDQLTAALDDARRQIAQPLDLREIETRHAAAERKLTERLESLAADAGSPAPLFPPEGSPTGCPSDEIQAS